VEILTSQYGKYGAVGGHRSTRRVLSHHCVNCVNWGILHHCVNWGIILVELLAGPNCHRMVRVPLKG
jgi:hypothetical protein